MIVQRAGDVSPSLGMPGDPARVTGQPVEGLRQRLDVVDDPRDAVLQQRSDRVGDDGQCIKSGGRCAKRALDSAAVLDAGAERFDVLSDPDTGERIYRGAGRARNQWVGGAHPALRTWSHDWLSWLPGLEPNASAGPRDCSVTGAAPSSDPVTHPVRLRHRGVLSGHRTPHLSDHGLRRQGLRTRAFCMASAGRLITDRVTIELVCASSYPSTCRAPSCHVRCRQPVSSTEDGSPSERAG